MSEWNVDEYEHKTKDPAYLDRLYILFGEQMTYEHFSKFMQLTRERKDYLFDLWLKKNGYV